MWSGRAALQWGGQSLTAVAVLPELELLPVVDQVAVRSHDVKGVEKECGNGLDVMTK